MDSFSLPLRGVFMIIATFLFTSAFVQEERRKSPDTEIWMTMLIVPSILTLLIAFDMKLANHVVIKAVKNLYIGCAMSFLFWIFIHLIIVLIRDSDKRKVSAFYDPTTGDFLYERAWRCVMLAGVIAWVKFMENSASRLLRNEGHKIKISSHDMIRSLCYVSLTTATAILVFVSVRMNYYL